MFGTALAALVAAVLWLVIDLDYPRAGLVRIGQVPMLELLDSLEASVGRAVSTGAGAEADPPSPAGP